MTANCASDDPAGVAEVALLSAEELADEPVLRFSPLASLIVLTLLSLASWAAIWAAVATLVAE